MGRSEKKASGKTETVSDQLTKKLATAAYRKVVLGEKPTAAEQAALRRYEKQQEEERRWNYYAGIPQKHWRQMSGRQTKVLNEQAERYGIPFGGRTINLPNVVRALHDFLAANARKLADDGLLDGDTTSPALERYREERAAMARLDRLEREQQLINRDDAHEALGRMAALIRTAGERLQCQFGPEAADVIVDALQDLERELDAHFGTQSAAADPESPG